MTLDPTNSQKIDFNDWLSNCPVQWFFHDGMTSDSSQDTAMYEFIFDTSEEDE